MSKTKIVLISIWIIIAVFVFKPSRIFFDYDTIGGALGYATGFFALTIGGALVINYVGNKIIKKMRAKKEIKNP